MQVRKVELDFSDAQVYWNPAEPEYCQFLNAISSMLPELEALLIEERGSELVADEPTPA